jgi:tetratricopeptide (TPR) repeat protein
LAALKYGHCALEEVNKALELDPKSSINYLSHGIGNYYLPAALGGGMDAAIKDFDRAIALDARSADAHLWLGLALRKLNRDAEARKEFQKSLELNPARVWTSEQLAKTPAQ